jgi:hypothetical protein
MGILDAEIRDFDADLKSTWRERLIGFIEWEMRWNGTGARLATRSCGGEFRMVAFTFRGLLTELKSHCLHYREDEGLFECWGKSPLGRNTPKEFFEGVLNSFGSWDFRKGNYN